MTIYYHPDYKYLHALYGLLLLIALISFEYLLKVLAMLFTSSDVSTIFAIVIASRMSLVCSHTYRMIVCIVSWSLSYLRDNSF
jgi:hypothetical protein